MEGDLKKMPSKGCGHVLQLNLTSAVWPFFPRRYLLSLQQNLYTAGP
jgi:hypothetical protein